MRYNYTAKEVNELLPSQRAEVIDRLYREGRKSMVEEDYGISARNAARYRRIVYLTPEFKELVEEYRLPLLSAVELSYLTEGEQKMVYEILSVLNIQLRPDVANQFRRLKGHLSKKVIEDTILAHEPGYVPAAGISISLPQNLCRRYFQGMDASQIVRRVENALAEWNRKHGSEKRLLQISEMVVHRYGV